MNKESVNQIEHVPSFWEVLQHTCSHGLSKITTGLMDLMVITLSFFSPAGPVLLAVGLAIFLDTCFGRWSARERDIEVTSKKTRVELIPKAVGYALVVLTLFAIDYAIINNFILYFFPASYVTTKIAGMFLIYIEYTSMNESYYNVKGVTFKELFRKFIKTIRGTLSEVLSVKNDLNKFKSKDKDNENKPN